jgi:hypothetical protein
VQDEEGIKSLWTIRSNPIITFVEALVSIAFQVILIPAFAEDKTQPHA